MSKGFNFNNITTNKVDNREIKNNDGVVFEIGEKEVHVVEKKYFQTHINPETLMEVDKIASRTGHTRNEIVVKMLEFCVNNVKYI